MAEEGSRHGRSRSDDCALHKPLMDDSTDEGTQSKTNAAVEGAQGLDKRLFRGHSTPSLVEQHLDHIRPPYKNTKQWSILSKAVFGLGLYFTVGIIVYYVFNQDLFGIKTTRFVDALYFCAVTLTTVGYGDLVPESALGKFFTCIYFFVGFVLVSGLISGAADYLVQKQESILVRAIKKKEKPGLESKEAGHVEAATFKVYVAGVLLLLIFIVGVVSLVVVEKADVVDAFYCVMVTVTTLGYGDRSFKTAGGRLFAAFWILASTVCLAQFLLYVAELQAVKRQLKLAHWVLHRKVTKPDLEAADMDNDGFVSASEFVLYKLKELGKIDEGDCAEVLHEFQHLDYNHTGKLKVGDARVEQAGE